MNTDVEVEGELAFGGHPDAESLGLAIAIDRTWLKTNDGPFADTLQAFKAVEAEFVARARGDEVWVLEIKRRVAEVLLSEAHGSQPFDTCQKLWNDLLRLGFTNIERKCMMTWFFADCCRKSKQPEVGLSVLEPLFAELESVLAEPTMTEDSAGYYQDQLTKMGRLRAKLKAQQGQP